MNSKNHRAEVVHLIRSKSNKYKSGDKVFKSLVVGASIYSLFMVFLVLFALSEGSIPVLLKEGFYFFIGTDWNAVEGRESFGALPYIVGTLASSAIAIVIAVPISIG
ncbi:MAG: hypothetical protein H0X03_03480, partial [Nitrosopumilus sp.]|nr:hypothetical protein [Nitrosopumilus sp.]